MEVLPSIPVRMLICCNTNALRSPMAEGMVKFLQGDTVYVRSAGIETGVLDQFAVSVMGEIDIDISGHRPTCLSSLFSESFDLILSLTPEAQSHAANLAEISTSQVIYWNTFDPSFVEGNRDVRLAAYQRVRDNLLNSLKDYFSSNTLVVPGPDIRI